MECVIKMVTSYEKILFENLGRLYGELPEDLDLRLGAKRSGARFRFRAFGEDCILSPDGVFLSGRPAAGPEGLLITLYALHAKREPVELEPFKSYRDFPGSMPYQGAFRANTENVLVPHITSLKKEEEQIKKAFGGKSVPAFLGGDFSFILYPLPKIPLCYLFYLEDEEFPPSATCLFSSNALVFMPLDGLADVAEYTSRKMIASLHVSTGKAF
jgi:hypothetical protein